MAYDQPRTAAAKRLSKKQRSNVVEEAQKGKPMKGKKGPHIGFSGLEEKIQSKGYDAEAAAKIAGAAFWKSQANKKSK